MMGYKAIKKIKIKQGYRKLNKTRQKIAKNNISYKEKTELKSLINKINDENVKKSIQKFANTFFTNIIFYSSGWSPLKFIFK